MLLTIRKEQMEALEEAALRQFENEMVLHIREFSPNSFETLGEPTIHQIVSLGIERAQKYELTNRGPVRFYIELMFMLGSDFDTDPQYPWVSKILQDHEAEDQMDRADLLHDKVIDYIQKTAGDDYEYEKLALQQISGKKYEDLQALSRERDIIEHLNIIYPQKCQYIGEIALNELLKRGFELGKAYGNSSMQVIALFVGLMFTFGHGCFTDLQFPWIAETLKDDRIVEPGKRFERLFSKMINYLNYALANIDKR